MKKNKISTLKDFLLAYGNKKSDIEISEMLSLPIEQIKSERGKIASENMKNKMRIH